MVSVLSENIAVCVLGPHVVNKLSLKNYTTYFLHKIVSGNGKADSSSEKKHKKTDSQEEDSLGCGEKGSQGQEAATLGPGPLQSFSAGHRSAADLGHRSDPVSFYPS
jgi:hypothetical protein